MHDEPNLFFWTVILTEEVGCGDAGKENNISKSRSL